MIISYKLFAFASIDNGNWLWVSIQGDRSSAQLVSIMYCTVLYYEVYCWIRYISLRSI